VQSSLTPCKKIVCDLWSRGFEADRADCRHVRLIAMSDRIVKQKEHCHGNRDSDAGQGPRAITVGWTWWKRSKHRAHHRLLFDMFPPLDCHAVLSLAAESEAARQRAKLGLAPGASFTRGLPSIRGCSAAPRITCRPEVPSSIMVAVHLRFRNARNLECDRHSYPFSILSRRPVPSNLGLENPYEGTVGSDDWRSLSAAATSGMMAPNNAQVSPRPTFRLGAQMSVVKSA
jgi:hypothetical protein